VTVNRTASLADFAVAQDSTTTDQIETWNQIVVAVPAKSPQGQFTASVTLQNGSALVFLGGGQAIGTANSTSATRFGNKVFLQLYRYFVVNQTYRSEFGPEIPAKVVSQQSRWGQIWLTLQPQDLLLIAGASIVVVTYQAGMSVSQEPIGGLNRSNG
jgi:hypothetical protein